MLLILESIVDNPQSWDDGSLTQASGLLQYLNSFLFCFLLFVFNKIFEQSSILFTVLQDRRIEFSYGASKIINFLRYLVDMCNDETFTETYQTTVDLVEHPSSRSDRKHNYKDIYLQLLNCMVFMLSDRFSDIENFEFLDLVDPNFFSMWKNKVPSTNLNKVITSYGPLFTFPDLESQLLFIYKDRDFHKENASELLEYIYKFNLQDCLPEVVKLLKKNGVIAISSASVERSFSCLLRVKTCICGNMGQERLGSLRRIRIHKDIFKELEEKKKLHDLIAEKFIDKPRRLNFLYK